MSLKHLIPALTTENKIKIPSYIHTLDSTAQNVAAAAESNLKHRDVPAWLQERDEGHQQQTVICRHRFSAAKNIQLVTKQVLLLVGCESLRKQSTRLAWQGPEDDIFSGFLVGLLGTELKEV